MKKSLFFVLYLVLFSIVFSQEALKSSEEEYYDLLSLMGITERPYLSYRTLSDNKWDIINNEKQSNIWENNNLGSTFTLWKPQNSKNNFLLNGISQKISLKAYGPEWYNSYNSAAPYGQNDGALWQGKGYNTALTGGLRLEGYGFELTFKPQISFSQNLPFDYTTPYSAYASEIYKNKADTYGDYSLGYIDAPQRFGNKSFYNFDFGDSEIRYTWYNLTAGFGTQNIWLGPAQINPIIHSNSAPGYPHLDFGLKRQRLAIKDFYLGDIEFRYWLGKTSESNYFDNNSINDSNLITGISIAYNVPFFDGLQIGFNRTMLSKWQNKNSYTLFTLLIPFMKKSAGYDDSDQRASIFARYYIPKGGIDLYLEWGKNDYNSGFDNLMRYPFHTQAITAGFKKAIDFKSSNKFYGQFMFEFTYLESSMDYHFFYDWGGSGNDFYSHGRITQGYTNNGQYLGAGIGAGGNAQVLGYKLFYSKGYTGLYLSRINPDLNYSYFVAKRDTSSSTPNDDIKSAIRVLFNVELSSLYYITKDFCVCGAFIFSDEHNPLNKNDNESVKSTVKSEHRYNFVTQLTLKYYF